MRRILAIDIGNTHTVFALCEGDAILETRRVETGQAIAAGGYEIFLDGEFDLSGVEGSVVSSVVPAADSLIQVFCRERLGKNAVMATRATIDITIDMARPEEVGADRLVNALAVKAYYTVPAIVVDLGTATTFDAVDREGRYIGGLIAPGINLSLKTLHEATAKLPLIKFEKPGGVIGKDTVSAMQGGMYWGYVGLIEGILRRMKAEMGTSGPLIIATGGLAPLFADIPGLITQVDEHLTLKGLIRIYDRHGQTDSA